ncbi:hypothetical protein ACIRO3_34950 [Streptomyces sp. NPDC102278]
MESYTMGQASEPPRVANPVDTVRRWTDADRFPTHREGNRRMARPT